MRLAPRDEIVQLLSEWPVGRVRDVSFDALGTINQTWLVTAERGRFAIRLSRHRDVEELKRECDLLAHVAGKGIPALRPLETRAGRPFLEREGLWTLTPLAPGFQVDRETMTTNHDRSMGRFLAKLLEALSDSPTRLAREKSFHVDADATLAGIDELEGLIRSHPNPAPFEDSALERLAGRRKWIVDNPAASTTGLTDRPSQVIHGDYQERNLFFDAEGNVLALIDWDNASLAPREWEILRTLDFVMLFDPQRARTFLDGYLELADLNLDALDAAALGYSVKRSHDLFLFDEIYRCGNERARQFLRPGAGTFTPPYERWLPLRDALARMG